MSIKEKLMAMRRKNERKKNVLKQKLLQVRSEMAENIQKATKKGSRETCRISRRNKDKINFYCDNNFSNRYSELLDCKEPSSFCYICCENEFGDVYIAERDQCYTMCDKKVELVKRVKKHERWQLDPKIQRKDN